MKMSSNSPVPESALEFGAVRDSLTVLAAFTTRVLGLRSDWPNACICMSWSGEIISGAHKVLGSKAKNNALGADDVRTVQLPPFGVCSRCGIHLARRSEQCRRLRVTKEQQSRKLRRQPKTTRRGDVNLIGG